MKTCFVVMSLVTYVKKGFLIRTHGREWRLILESLMKMSPDGANFGHRSL